MRWTTAVIIGVLVALAAAGCGKQPAAESAGAAAAVDLKPQTALPETRSFALDLPWTGQVRSRQQVEVEALIDGRVESVAVADEASVEKGATLFTIGGARAEAQRRQLREQVDSLSKRVELARQVVERQNQSMKDRLATLNEIAAARDTLEKLTAELDSARRQLQVAEEGGTVTAPAAGVFTARRVSAGQAVTAGQALAEVVDPAHLRIEAHVYAPAGVALKGLAATVRLSQTETLTGTVARVLPAGDAAGAELVWIEGPQVDSGLRIGQTVGGTLAARTHKALAVPQSALVYDEQEAPYVFVERGGRFEKTAVQTGIVSDGWVEVVSGLDGKAPVVTSGAYELLYRGFRKSYQVAD